jgi:hypothetical protein
MINTLNEIKAAYEAKLADRKTAKRQEILDAVGKAIEAVTAYEKTEDPEAKYEANGTALSELEALYRMMKGDRSAIADIRSELEHARNALYREASKAKMARQKAEEEAREAEFEAKVAACEVELTAEWALANRDRVSRAAFAQKLEEAVGTFGTWHLSRALTEELPKLDTPHSEFCEAIIKAARLIGLKAFALTGRSTGLMQWLFEAHQLGCTIEMSSYEREACGEVEIEPMCIVRV